MKRRSKHHHQRKRVTAKPPETPPSKPRKSLGVITLCLAAIGLAAAIQSLSWQLQTRLRYTAGTCRVVAAEIVEASGNFELRIAHQVEAHGQVYPRNENTEQYTPSYRRREDAEASLANYAVGSVHPCWYDARNPRRYSVLVRYSMDTGTQCLVLAASLLLGTGGVWLVGGFRRSVWQLETE
ncbi:MAG: DUF3592 domain-containing protein [Pirellulaceae bacterium]